MVDLISIEQLQDDLNLGEDVSQVALLTRLRAAAQRRCEGYMGRKVDGDETPLTDEERQLVASAVSILVGFLFRDRDVAQDLPRTVTWLLDDIRVVGDDA